MNYIYDIIAIRLDTKNKPLIYQRLPITPRWGFRSAKSYARMKAMQWIWSSLYSSSSYCPAFPRPGPGRTLHLGIDNKRDTPFGVSLLLNQRLPILPGRHQPSTFSVYELNYCVRDGNRWTLVAIATESVRVCTLKTT